MRAAVAVCVGVLTAGQPPRSAPRALDAEAREATAPLSPRAGPVTEYRGHVNSRGRGRDLATSSRSLPARAHAQQHAANLQDSGLTHLLPKERCFVLTVDLCPSRNHFDVMAPKRRPVPIAFAVSGRWLKEPDDPRLPLRRNVMLERGLTPSVFFQFPIGSDAWFTTGSVVVHGNGTAPRGRERDGG